jgi:hypothetical protein
MRRRGLPIIVILCCVFFAGSVIAFFLRQNAIFYCMKEAPIVPIYSNSLLLTTLPLLDTSQETEIHYDYSSQATVRQIQEFYSANSDCDTSPKNGVILCQGKATPRGVYYIFIYEAPQKVSYSVEVSWNKYC